MKGNKNWLERNWKWAVPSGCLTVLTLMVLFGLIIMGVVFQFIKSSPVYEEALRVATTHEEVRTRLGTPITEGFLVMGNINVSGPSGQANLSFPIKGPQGKAQVIVDATKVHNVWQFNFLAVDIASTGERIILQDSTQETQ